MQGFFLFSFFPADLCHEEALMQRIRADAQRTGDAHRQLRHGFKCGKIQRHDLSIRLFEHARDDILVLLRQHRAGGLDHLAAGAQKPERFEQERLLLLCGSSQEFLIKLTL